MNHHLLTMNPKKKHTLKPGKHQFAPGEQAVHDNDSLTDAEAEWYLQHYPHISALFANSTETVQQKEQPPVSPKKPKSNIRNSANENLPTSN